MLMKPYIQNTFQNALCKCRLMWSKNKTFKLGVSNSKNPSHTEKILLWCPFSGICKEISGSTIPAQAKIIYFMTLLDKGMLGQHKFPIMNTEGIFVVKTFIGLQMLCMLWSSLMYKTFRTLIAFKKHVNILLCICSGSAVGSLLVTTNKADNHSISPKNNLL